MDIGKEAADFLKKQLDCKMIWEDQNHWDELSAQAEIAQVQYKALHLKYQETYFQEINKSYTDISLVLYRGGCAVGIWPLCVWEEDSVYIGSAGIAHSPAGGILPPLLPGLHKAEAQRKVFDQCVSALQEFLKRYGGNQLRFCETVMESGVSLWHRVLMERGAECVKIAHQLYTDLRLSMEEIQNRIRRTNKYSVAKGYEDYEIELYDERSENTSIVMEEFRQLHINVAGRETRGKQTWEAQKLEIERGTDEAGHSFAVLIRDKQTGMLAGAALFDATPSCAYYCVAAYDRSRFSKPVGHVVQAVAMQKLKEYGVRWYELGERTYAADESATEKLMDIGHYKEGFATHWFLKLYTVLNIVNSGAGLR